MGFNVTNCRGCGKLFNKIGVSKICPECNKKLEEKYIQVRDYIREHKGVSIIEVSKENEVPIEQIRTWIREERIELDSANDPDFGCMSCGVAIKSGKYCDYCKGKLVSQLKGVYVAPQRTQREGLQSDKDKMRFLQK